MAHLAIASALGFRVHPDEVAATLLSVPGLSIRRLEREGRRVKGDAASVIADGLKSGARDVMFDLHGRTRNEWGFLWATTTKATKKGEFDITVVNWPAPLGDGLVNAFANLCECAVAEFGYLDEVDPFPGFRILGDLAMGIPGVAWAMWAGPQLAQALPAFVREDCWHAVEPRGSGRLLRTGELPLSDRRRRAIMDCIGGEAFAPRKEPLSFDLSRKNTVTPEWVKKGVPPELPPELRVVGVVPKKGDGTE
jgi:hypothetical protein